MTRLCNYTEYGSSNGISMREHFENQPYNGKDKIVAYLRSKGKSTMVQMKVAEDRLTGERIKGMFSLELLTDGKFSWWSDLAYHVEKYNLRLPKEFEDYVLNYCDKVVLS